VVQDSRPACMPLAVLEARPTKTQPVAKQNPVERTALPANGQAQRPVPPEFTSSRKRISGRTGVSVCPKSSALLYLCSLHRRFQATQLKGPVHCRQLPRFLWSLLSGLHKDSVVGLDSVHISDWFGSSSIPMGQVAVILLLTQ
jgi:hypothetical protein